MLRIVSLIASATEIVHALGLSPYQVGRSHECDHPPSVLALPVCTEPTFPVAGSSAEIDRLVKERLASLASIYTVDPLVLDSLRPTHILTQTQCKVCAVSLQDVERALAGSLGARPAVVPLEPNSLADIWSDIRRVAHSCNIPAQGDALVAQLQSRIAAISITAHSQPSRPRVACIEWHEPLMAAGNWVPELVHLANADNLFGEPGRHSPWMTWDQLTAADPDVIVTMPCGFDLPRTQAELHWLTGNPAWPKLKAVQTGQVYLVDGNRYMNRPGPRTVESLQILAEILHPAAFPPYLQHTAWQKPG